MDTLVTYTSITLKAREILTNNGATIIPAEGGEHVLFPMGTLFTNLGRRIDAGIPGVWGTIVIINNQILFKANGPTLNFEEETSHE